MIEPFRRLCHPRSGFAAAVTLFALAAAAPIAGAAKDQAPASRCDASAPDTGAWRACALSNVAAASDEELFYAGYWLARLGRYDDAISYLSQARAPDARTLTYLGFATRKRGDVEGAFVHYRSALRLDPDFVVARAYMGEAFLALGDLDAARAELAEIARRCPGHCAAHDELARHVARYEEQHG